MFSQIHLFTTVCKWKNNCKLLFLNTCIYPYIFQQGIDLWRDGSCSYTARAVGHGSGISSSHSFHKHQTLDCVNVPWRRATMFLIPSLFICTHTPLTLFFSPSSLYCTSIRNSECKNWMMVLSQSFRLFSHVSFFFFFFWALGPKAKGSVWCVVKCKSCFHSWSGPENWSLKTVFWVSFVRHECYKYHLQISINYPVMLAN